MPGSKRTGPQKPHADGLAGPQDATATSTIPATVVDEILRSLRGLRFGTVTVIVQDGVVVPIDRTEKTRVR